jgi:hypothetical protein
MSASVQPQFTQRANIQTVKFGGTALTTSDGSSGSVGTSMILLFTPGANDSYVEAVRIIPVGSSASASYSATVARIYISTVNTGSPTATNTHLIAEIAIPAATVDQTTVAVNWFDVPLGMRIAGSGATTPQYMLISSHIVNGSNTNTQAICFAADY